MVAVTLRSQTCSGGGTGGRKWLGVKLVKVLLVDDDVSIRTMLRVAMSLETDFEEIREAIDGADALQVMRDYRPDVIVLDYTMPRMNGAEVAELVRTTQPETRIIVFSGDVHERPEWADACFVKGAEPDLKQLISSARRVA